MKTLIAGLGLGVLLTLAILLIGAAGLGRRPHHPPTITVTGEARLTGEPDTALVMFGIEKNGKTVAEAQEKVSQALDKVIAALQAAGIEKADIYTSDFTIGNNWWYWDSPPKTINVSSTLTITVRQVRQVGRVVDTALANGLNRMQGVSYEVRDPQWKDKALQAARADARRKAEALVPAADKSRLRLLSLAEAGAWQTSPDEQFYSGYAASRAKRALAESWEGMPRTRSLPGQRALTVTVKAVYRF
jgi:hypothetical protein